MKENKQLLVFLHLSQLLDLVTGFGGLLVPLIIWLTQKEEVFELDQHGKSIINFQLSILLYGVLAIPLIFLFGFGFVVLAVIAILATIFPVINAISTSHGELTRYPFSIKFIR